MRLFKYKELFKLSIKNEYYRSGYSPDFSIIPSRQCEKLLKDHGLKMKAMPHGAVVYGEVGQDNNDDKLFRGFSKEVTFVFLMKLNNPFFVNFTDVPIQQERHRVYYFNNLTNHASDGKLFLVNKEEIPKVTDNAARITLSPEIYTYTCSGTGEEKTGTLSFVGEGLSIDQTIGNTNGEFRFQFDLSRYNQGRCRFTVDGQSERFYLAKELYREDIFGIIEIAVKSSVPANYRFVDADDTITMKEYVIPFTNRSTIWRYLVYDKMTNTLDKPRIQASGLTFRRQETPAVNYPEDFSLFTFTSREPGSPGTEKALPLQEQPVKNITLSGKVNGPRRDIIEHLPNPDVSLIKPDTTDTGKIYSDIILYV